MRNLYRGPSKDASYQISIHLAKWTETWWEAHMEGSELSFLKAEWKVSGTGSAHWASSLTTCSIVVLLDIFCTWEIYKFYLHRFSLTFQSNILISGFPKWVRQVYLWISSNYIHAQFVSFDIVLLLFCVLNLDCNTSTSQNYLMKEIIIQQSLPWKIVHLLAWKQNLEIFSIYLNKVFHNFHLSESSFTCCRQMS